MKEWVCLLLSDTRESQGKEGEGVEIQAEKTLETEWKDREQSLS